jgi:hypothetical protein
MMDIEKWINENQFDAYDAVCSMDIICVEQLRELLKTHTLVPNEPTEKMLSEIHLDERFSDRAMQVRYKAMLSASKEQ